MSIDERFHLDRLIASSPVVIIWGEPLGNRPVHFVSAGICQFGYTVPEIVMEETPYDSIVFEADRERLHSAFRESLAKGVDSFEIDYRIVTRSGEVRWVEDRIVFYRDDRGEAVLYQSSLLDITERKTVELRLAESDMRLERVLSLARVGIWESVPESDEITGVGRASLLGMSEDEMPRSRGELWERLFSPEDRERHEKAWRDVLEGRADEFQAELSVPRDDGSDLWILKKGFPVRDERGDVVKIQGTTVDITAIKKAEELALHQSESLSTLHGISLSFMEELDPEVLGRRILEKATELADAVDGLVGVVEEDPFYRRNLWGVGFYEDLIGRRIPVTEGMMGEVIRTNRRLVVDDYRVYPGRMDLDEYKHVTTALSIPLRRGEGLLGVLSISYRDRVRVLDEPVLDLMEQFASAAAIALESSLLYKKAGMEIRERRETEERLLSHRKLVESAVEAGGFLFADDSEEKSLSMALRTLARAVDADSTAFIRASGRAGEDSAASVLVFTGPREDENELASPLDRARWEEF
ncbi:MAG: PAS domain-containing protein, partial [Synergistota bacterium]|nr:PAS domain-containing protein [Synergistota bacterium]